MSIAILHGKCSRGRRIQNLICHTFDCILLPTYCAFAFLICKTKIKVSQHCPVTALRHMGTTLISFSWS